MCGGYAACLLLPDQALGLSPRVRGILPQDIIDEAMEGSIPACAGDTIHEFDLFFATKVYPRVCGGYDASGASSAQDKGLSPRVRGIRASPAYCAGIRRSIPACAGDTLAVNLP